MAIWWDAMDAPRRLLLVTGSLLVLAATAWAGWWLLRTDYAVLFSELKPQDAAVLSAELERQKVPFQLADGGATLLAPAAQVPQLRLKLMGKELPLHGVVGLELFNHADFGMTEFAQKINYQRALQGELTRTILALQEVREARVHLALPEQGLFRQATARPKAAITLTLRRGQLLRPQQVSGIQRLVAAAVPGLSPAEVTVVDQQGLALSRAPDAEPEVAGTGRMDMKREVEDHLSRKAGAVLEQAFGPGQALASVDVSLQFDQVRVTTEDVLPAGGGRGGPAGVLVRERESVRDTAAPEPRDGRSVRGSSSQRDVEYQAGRRVEQVVTPAGAIRRIHAVVVLRQPPDARRREEVRELVAAAIGASQERGDVVVVQGYAAPPPATVEEQPAAAAAPAAPPVEGRTWLALGAGLGSAVVMLLLLRRRRVRPATVQVLDDGDRRLALQRVEAWLNEASPAASPSAGARHA